LWCVGGAHVNGHGGVWISDDGGLAVLMMVLVCCGDGAGVSDVYGGIVTASDDSVCV